MLNKRIKILAYIFAVISLCLITRLGWICVRDGKSYETMAIRQRNRSQHISNLRAPVYDRKSRELTYDDYHTIYLGKDGVLGNNKDAACTAEIKKRTPSLASHIIGYTSSGEGICGIEKLYNDLLKTNGKEILTYTANGADQPLGDYMITRNHDTTSAAVRLTLDYNIQKITEDVMDKYISSGAAVILDIESFDVVASASRPDYDADNIESYIDSEKGELLNRVFMPYNAGSVFKIVTAAAALEAEPSIANEGFECRGDMILPSGHIFRCNKLAGHGNISFNSGFAHSCNLVYYNLGLSFGGGPLINTAYKFGMGQKLLNTYPNESPGHLPWRWEYSPAESLNIAIGQGEILITPLQCAALAATIASGGIRKDINIVDSYTLPSGEVISQRRTGDYRVIQNETARCIAAMMNECTLYGTAAELKDCTFGISGKTGSAETGWVKNNKTMVHGWFCGFFPSDNPKYAMAILSEDGGSGSGSCLKPFREIAEAIIENNL